MVGHGEDQLPLPRARHRAPLERRAERARHDQPGARLRPHRQAEERLRHDRRPGQRPGRPRARAEMRSAARLARHQQSRASHATSPASGASTRASCPGPASTPTRCSGRSTPARSRACCRSASTRRSRCRTTRFITRCLDKLEFFVAIDFFLNDTARHADIVLPGSLQEEDEGTVTQVEGRVIKINKAVDCPGEARQDWRIIQDIAARLGRPHGFTFAEPREIFEELRRREQGRRRRLLRHHLREDRAARWASSGRATARIRDGQPIDHPGHAAPLRARQLQPGREGRGAVLLPGRQGALQRRRLPRRRSTTSDDEYPVYPDDRPRRQPVPVGHADPPDRPARGTVPGAAHRDASAPGRAARHRRRRVGDGRNAARRSSRCARRS